MRSYAFLTLALIMPAAVVSSQVAAPLQARLMPSETPNHEAAREPAKETQRVASRLIGRIAGRYGFQLGVSEALRGIKEQRELLARSVQVEFSPDDGKTLEPWRAGAERFLQVEISPMGMRSTIDQSRIAAETINEEAVGVIFPKETVLLSTSRDEDGIWRATTSGVAKSGYEYEDDPVRKIAEALEQDEEAVAVRLRSAPGRIHNESLEELGELALLASGRSNFAGSGEGRKANIRKGLTKYIHNAMVEPGQEFSINGILKHVPIKEWEMALGIFGGGILRPVAGGGLCQVATTLYRGILNAGFPVTQRSNHSLFVHYYEKYGVGIDSTIFPASAPDLRFINDTASPLLIQAYVEDAEATVNIYGTPDGRTVRMTGPYFAENAPEEFRVNGRKLSSREIAWVRDVAHSDGRESQDIVLSRYKTIPRSVVREHARTLATAPANALAADLLRMHAAAGEKESMAQEPALDVHARVQ